MLVNFAKNVAAALFLFMVAMFCLLLLMALIGAIGASVG